MVFRHLFGSVLRETAQQQLQSMTASVEEVRARNAGLRCDVLVVVALSIEAGGLADRLADVAVVAGKGFTERIGRLGTSPKVGIVETGPGETRAAKATAEVIAAREPQWVISAGFAGALVPKLPRGDFVMADSVAHDTSAQQLSIGLTMDRAALDAAPNVHIGRIVTVDRIVDTPKRKRALGEKHEALGCDMETFAVARCSAAAKKRFLSVRIISDAVDDELPPEVQKLLNQNSTAGQLGAATAALWNRPSSAKDMWKLKEEAMRSSDRLAKFLTGVIAQLPVERRNVAEGNSA